ncbi:bifunctional lysine-specific demethylase and histidyl-hydroxylase NO66 [Drosophila guanche]|uniref:Bifunctional lysine-specific demethylase and histidyl-hydroxylase n=1 Tax=Drosophila guanche TaxID=7266 RepID=A0A3B0JED2_DROGU|nr:bifunctional lysine-specific demethylase and histidyl-hydroxylase NO66 [Drosophila guanche]SPP78532.1 blast:Bifunctional lysine-specific demethylase and histidyl-hydroxylase NO66 [Drosophila guanche]
MSEKKKMVSAFAAYRSPPTAKNAQKGAKNAGKNVAAKNTNRNVAARNANRNMATQNGVKQKGQAQKNGSYSDAANCSSSEDDSSDSGSEHSHCSSHSDDSHEEYTLNSHSSTASQSQSSPEALVNKRQSLKRRLDNEFKSKPSGAKRTSSTPEGPSTSAAWATLAEQQPKASTSASNKRKSLPVTTTHAKSCPLPTKNKKVSQGHPADAPSCPLLSKKNALPVKVEPVASMPCSINIGSVKSENALEPHKDDSIKEGERALATLIAPMTMAAFLSEHWEKEAFRVASTSTDRFCDLISFNMIDQMLLQNHVEYTTNIDVTSYEDGVRQTLNPDGRALPPSVWAHYRRGCSIRILNPSTYLVGLRQLCSKLQEFFHCLVGANVYLTPPESQGFAPHYDDIEAFVLQVEGKKRWRIYLPTKELPRVSSGNLSQAELGEPLMDIVLNPGDVLYFPRGWIHQAVTEKNSHSLHITLSAYQQQSYANLMEKLMPLVLAESVEQSLNLRKGLPLNIWKNLGVANDSLKGQQRQKMIQHIQNLAQRMVPTANQIDQALDQLAIRFQHEALPPTIAPAEKKRTVFGIRHTADENGRCSHDYKFTASTAVRLLRANIVRLTIDDGVLRCYYYTDNALEYCKYEPNFFELEHCQATTIQKLIHAYPEYVKIKDLQPKDTLPNEFEERLEFAEALWERGILMVEKPFKNHP